MYKILLLTATLFLSFQVFHNNKSVKNINKNLTANNSFYIEAIDSISSKNYLFYVIRARDENFNKFKIMDCIEYDSIDNNCNKIKVNKKYKLKLSSWLWATTYKMDGITIDDITFEKDSIYDDIYGSTNLKGLCLIKEEE